ncbi:hypothetical protein Q7458_07255 [Glaesserella parasuis]|uniref:hypothetical protein n=1 Tax=Glaesserella parasuis TaxID=738 RepID=UPI0013E0BABE|nr:hypothetical protein [Glaesserella parasuis]MDO9799162.1 hypothetical protein [Glaesserella parasuis]MDO9851224.1 hypothetical protein [Glaesserella parasuis]MDO9865282.1 hypothetical protein [Glaesserella parasuis]MDO9882441.1 hypothetical protein [Glaesserella parasuis]MDO9884932.1 hypothetical protein [Glaesserella parasuis]
MSDNTSSKISLLWYFEMVFRTILLMGLLLTSTISVQAKIFEAEGYGDTPEIAKKDAVSNAIKFSVGEFIVNKEELSNDTFNQKIVGYSNAYVKKINVLSQEKQGDEYLVRVAVDIESQKLIDALKEMQISVVNNAVDQETLSEVLNHFDKVEQNKNTKNNFESLVTEFLVSPYEENKELVEIKILGKLKAISPSKRDEESGLFPLKLDIEIGPSKAYLDGFRRILQEAKEDKNSNSIQVYEFDLNKNESIERSYVRAKRTYYLSIDKAQMIMDKLYRNYSNYEVIKMQLIDENSEIFKEVEFCTYDYHCSEEQIPKYTKTEKHLYFGPYGFKYALLPNADGKAIYFTSGKAKISLIFKLTKEEILNIKDLKLSFSN